MNEGVKLPYWKTNTISKIAESEESIGYANPSETNDDDSPTGGQSEFSFQKLPHT
jgi:hypothetical protein